MAFSLRKIISNISYFKKEDGTDPNKKSSQNNPVSYLPSDAVEILNIDCTEPDSTSLKLHNSLKSFATKKGSSSDTDLLNLSSGISRAEKKDKRRSKKLNLDIQKASTSSEDVRVQGNVENTPKQYLLDSKSSELFSERLKKFDFDQSFDLFDVLSDEEENVDIESFSSDSDSIDTDIKMCRKVEEPLSVYDSEPNVENRLVPAKSLDSFGDVEIDKSEEERTALLLNYQTKLEGIESYLKKVFADFRFHLDVSKILQYRSVTPLKDVGNNHAVKIPKNLIDMYRSVSPIESWNIVLEKEDEASRLKLQQRLLSIKILIEEFINNTLNAKTEIKSGQTKKRKAITYKSQNKSFRASKKKFRHFDFPDYRESFLNLFCQEHEDGNASLDENNYRKCSCGCHSSPLSESYSDLPSKAGERSMSITSSIGNFSLDSSTLTAYSESLDHIISYNSFQDTSLCSTLLQKVAIERITFYVQVHSIQVRVEASNEFESKNVIKFHCPACLSTETDEHGLLKHILSSYHCEKIHFLYKTAYIKKCVQSGKEIQPSTVLNPMKMYRDDNKIVCFGEAMYACSLCFENLISGESVLMAHCNEAEHISRREKLEEIIE